MELNSNQIQQILPHRYPFLLVDKITDYEPGKWAKGIKCVTANEMHFMGHFPQQHVMPGVLILEAMAQVGGVSLLSLEENRGKIALCAGVTEARFKGQVVPGDVLEMETEIVRQKGPVGIGSAIAKVNGKVVAKAELMFAVSEDK